MFVGEAPGREEDEIGRPFVGEAGKLLTQLLKSVGIQRRKVYITNVIKCRPPNNRDPQTEEIEQCKNWLYKQIEIIQPKLICTLGRYATYCLLSEKFDSFSEVRGKIYTYKGSTIIPTYHPAALLYHPKWKDRFINDLKYITKLLRSHGK
jgi:DNA polymerase